MSYYIAKIRQYYGPSEQLSIISDESGNPEAFDSIAAAKEAIAYFASGRYELSNNECSRPDYVIIDQGVVDWLDMDDGGKYDWDEYEGEEGDEDAEYAFMRAKDIEYVREHDASECDAMETL